MKDKTAGTVGFLTRLKMLTERNRLGELLVLGGALSQGDLRYALAAQKAGRAHLGRILLEHRLISRQRLYGTLAQQYTLRGLAALVTVMIGLTGVGVKSARAGPIGDIPPVIRLAAEANAVFTPVAAYPSLFGSSEKRAANISPFTKWSDMFARFDSAARTAQGQRVMAQWKENLEPLEGLPLRAMAEKVNGFINETEYIVDQKNWGKSDYWETPVEFFTRGGDCEDFAIAKYASLRALGVPEERLRVAIVHDRQKNMPHAVLIVYTESGEALILDNQTDSVRDSARIDRYKPIFSINRTAWWLHTAPDRTVLASAE